MNYSFYESSPSWKLAKCILHHHNLPEKYFSELEWEKLVDPFAVQEEASTNQADRPNLPGQKIVALNGFQNDRRHTTRIW